MAHFMILDNIFYLSGSNDRPLSSVPLGSGLGPLFLFLVPVTCDMAFPTSYAHDTSLYYPFLAPQNRSLLFTQLNVDFKRISSLCQRWCTKLNTNRINNVIFGRLVIGNPLHPDILISNSHPSLTIALGKLLYFGRGLVY